MGWEWHKKNNLEYLTIPQWSAWGVEVAFSTRNHGVSAKPYSSLNLALHVDDNVQNVRENRKIFLKNFAADLSHCVVAQQVHGTKVIMASHADQGRGMWESTTAVPECDGMVTREDIGLMCFYADCVPLFFFHPPTGMVGLAHAGWKGTANKIVREVFNMIREAGGTAEDCFAAIGPCIGSCCYEVGENVAAVFNENFNDMNILSRTTPGKYQLDLVNANLSLLLQEGVLPENISIANLCTSCHNDIFFSYRKEGITGRMAAFIMKRKGVK